MCKTQHVVQRSPNTTNLGGGGQPSARTEIAKPYPAVMSDVI